MRERVAHLNHQYQLPLQGLITFINNTKQILVLFSPIFTLYRRDAISRTNDHCYIIPHASEDKKTVTYANESKSFGLCD